jgi:hypothetical protein
MRERSELMGGRIVFSTPAAGGTLLHLIVPRKTLSSGTEIKNKYDKKDHGVAGG